MGEKTLGKKADGVSNSPMAKRSMHVAVVDDDFSFRHALSKLLLSHEFKVWTYATATEFLQHHDTHTTDCLLLDYELPDLTGLEVLRELGARGVKLPTILMTGRDSSVIRQSGLAAGAAAFLVKPFGGALLIETMESATQYSGESSTPTNA
jgi:FixJ family two-component response regulator